MPLRGSAKASSRPGKSTLNSSRSSSGQVRVGHVEPRGGDVVERDRAAPVGVAERLEVALGGHRHAPARLGVGDQLHLGWAARRSCLPWFGHDLLLGAGDTPTTGQAASTDSVRCSTACRTGRAELRADSVPLAVGSRRAGIASRECSLSPSSSSPRSSGPVERGFDPGRPFEAGRHRGIDLAAAPGTPVRAACAGPVVVAGRVGSSGGVVTVRCGPWRVTHMPLATIGVRGGRSRRARRRDRHRRCVDRSRGPASRRSPGRHEVRIRRPAALPRGTISAGTARPRATDRATATDRPAAARRAADRPAAARLVAIRAVAGLGRPGARARRRGPARACAAPRVFEPGCQRRRAVA